MGIFQTAQKRSIYRFLRQHLMGNCHYCQFVVTAEPVPQPVSLKVRGFGSQTFINTSVGMKLIQKGKLNSAIQNYGTILPSSTDSEE